MTASTATYKELETFNNACSQDGEGSGGRRLRFKWPGVGIVVLSITTLIFGLQALHLFLRPAMGCPSQALGGGFSTEWGPAKGSIRLQEVRYTSAFRYNETSKSYYREYDPASPQYVGTPSRDIDNAWGELLSGQYLVLSGDEVQELENPVAINGVYLAEVEVMHSLHCLNAIRKALDQEYYSEHEEHPLPEDLNRIHIEHCIEQLRQNIQCAGDLTPVPLRPFGEKSHKNLIGTPQVHTCRNWEVFRNWYTNRGLEKGRVNVGGM